MQTVRINVYALNELSEKAQNRAYCNWQQYHEYHNGADNRQTLKAFCALFDVYCNNHSYDTMTYNYSFFTRHTGKVENLSGVRLATYLYNHYFERLFVHKKFYTKNYKKSRESKVFYSNECVLTGYCADVDILQPVYGFLEKPEECINFYDLIDICLNNFFAFCQCDYEAYMNEESFEEDVSETLYFENGDVYLNTQL